jgi:ribonucleotide reductase beta subunit family protein with ferritin-like domain
VDYPEAVKFADDQASVFWPHNEVKVHKDKQDILVNMSESERHGTITVLKLFTKYEQIIGDEFWINFVFKKFPRPADIQPMAALFGAMELQVHGKFYAKLNEELGLATNDFYNEYLEDPELKERIDFLQNTLKKDDLRALGCFTFGEGAVLYSSFAYLKHFQSQGKNKLVNVVSGINFSARDEALHSEAAAWLFRTLLQEKQQANLISIEEVESLEKDIYEAAQIVFEHEKLIIAKIFSKGKIDGITDTQLEHFAQSRINLCLRNLGYKNLFKVEYNPIQDWFYKGINGYQMQDFFNSQGNQYTRDWDTHGFSF